MKLHQIGRAAALLLCLPLTGAFAQTDADATASQPDSQTNTVEERVTDDNGVIRVCGEGDGMEPCLDANGQTYAQEVKGPGLDDESDREAAAEAARVRAESPKALDHTISEMEQGYNPDEHATMGLPD